MSHKKNKTLFIKDIWKQKKERRLLLAKLPIKEKIKIIIRLQQALYPILVLQHPGHLKPWKLKVC